MDERNKQTNSNRLIDTEKRMTPVREERDWVAG